MIPLRLEELDSYFYLACMAVVGMAVISTYFIRGTPNQQVRGFVVCLLAAIVATPLLGFAILFGGIYFSVGAAIVVMAFVVQQFNRWADKKNPRKGEEPADDVPPVPAAAPDSPGQRARKKQLRDGIVGFAVVYPVVLGFFVLPLEPDGILFKDYLLAFLPPIIAFWWFPIKTYGARILYVAPAAAVYAILVSGFLIVVCGYDDCPVRRVVQNSECIPKQWENSAQTYFREHPDPPIAAPSGGK